MTERVELLSPAGNLEKLRFAVDYGADAVYCAPERFGMRAAAGNFTSEALAEGADYAHRRGAKLYVTLNTMPRDSEMALLPSCVAALRDAGADAFIVADAGVAEVVRSVYPQAVLHLSTQASVVNAAACRFWYRQGFRRIVLARELTLEEIYFIRRNTPDELELEVFVHGAMCVAYSGRCLLSSYYTSRSANEGRCTQPCRWKYRVAEEKRPEDILRAEQDENGSYLFSSRDLCMIEHLGELADAGADAFKIEGRMKSAYYAAAVTNAYRLAYENARRKAVQSAASAGGRVGQPSGIRDGLLLRAAVAKREYLPDERIHPGPRVPLHGDRLRRAHTAGALRTAQQALPGRQSAASHAGRRRAGHRDGRAFRRDGRAHRSNAAPGAGILPALSGCKGERHHTSDMRLYELMQHKITVISGHFGSGKTNVALNLALDAADAGEQVSIADLDIVNPYFRTADSEAFLRARGIKPLVPQYANTNVEIPTLPEALGEIFYGGRRAVVDVGGDPEGAAALGCDRDRYAKAGYDMYFVCSFYRPATLCAENALTLLRETELASGMRFCGIINNSNLGRLTEPSTVEATLEEGEKLARLAGIPVAAVTAAVPLSCAKAVRIQNLTKQLF